MHEHIEMQSVVGAQKPPGKLLSSKDVLTTSFIGSIHREDKGYKDLMQERRSVEKEINMDI